MGWQEFSDMAQESLGITKKQAGCLFQLDGWRKSGHVDLYQAYNHAAYGYDNYPSYRCNYKGMARAVADRINRFIRTGK
jgi:hypothetical protein